jgi:PadR family transcriptional regulator, regulatory protein PadR
MFTFMMLIVYIYMKGTYLGEFEELILLAVASQGKEAYAVSVKQEVEEKAKRKINISAVHSALYRLEEKRFLKSSFGGATQKRGGKDKRLFQATQAGLAALNDSRKLRESFWKDIPALTLRKA